MKCFLSTHIHAGTGMNYGERKLLRKYFITISSIVTTYESCETLRVDNEASN
jgi:hypothetical protein